ncbi:nitrile hydratase accessory protein [Mycobacterium sp. MMS18-G62]
MSAPLDVDGPAAPPRSNGELVFAEPWESRAFGMAVALCEAGVFSWPQFQGALIARIEQWQATSTDGTQWSYYDHWLGALEDVLAPSVAVVADDITARARELARRPAGHDHSH